MQAKENIKRVFWLNLGFGFFEIIGGIITRSSAIFSNAICDFGDALAILVSYLLENISKNKPDKEYTFGYKRYALLGIFFNSMILLICSSLVLYDAFLRILRPVEVNIIGMIIFSIFGIFINGYAMFKTSDKVNLNESKLNLYVIIDFCCWISFLVAAILIKITGWHIIDPLLSMLIAIIMAIKGIKNMFRIINIFTEKVPNDIEIETLENELKQINLVKEVNCLHVWSMDGKDKFLTVQIIMDQKVTKKSYETLLQDIKKKLKEYKINQSTVELEYESTSVRIRE